MKLSVIIVSYNVKELLLGCLASLFQEPVNGMEVIVVDNASADGSAEAVRSSFPDVKVIANTVNKGFSAANNQGIQTSGGAYILLLNPDTKVVGRGLNELMRFVSGRNTATLVAPQLLNADGSIQESAWWFPGITEVALRAFFLNKICCAEQYAPAFFEDDFIAEGLSGAALLIARSRLDQIGSLDEDLFWSEDVDLCYRNVKAGGKNIYWTGAQVIHYSGQSTRKNYRIPISNQLISKLKFFRKHFGKGKMGAGAFFVFFHIILRLIVLLPLCIVSADARKKLDAYFYTLKKFFRYIFTGDQSTL